MSTKHKPATPDQQAQATRDCLHAGYRDGYAGSKASPPAWDTIPEWSNAYAEGYKLGQQAAQRTGRPIKQRSLI